MKFCNFFFQSTAEKVSVFTVISVLVSESFDETEKTVVSEFSNCPQAGELHTHNLLIGGLVKLGEFDPRWVPFKLAIVH